MPVQVGQPAPNVPVQAYDRTQDGKDDQFRKISLDDYKGKWPNGTYIGNHPPFGRVASNRAGRAECL
jgi:hypothetical protein